MYQRCPGQDNRNLSSRVLVCPGCGGEVEIFSDEVMVRCRECGRKVYGEKTPSCADWCAAARQCMGEERWRQLKGKD